RGGQKRVIRTVGIPPGRRDRQASFVVERVPKKAGIKCPAGMSHEVMGRLPSPFHPISTHFNPPRSSIEPPNSVNTYSLFARGGIGAGAALGDRPGSGVPKSANVG